MRTIQLTENNNNNTLDVVPHHIETFVRHSGGKYTVITLGNDNKVYVKETPKQIRRKLRWARGYIF